MQIYRCSSAWIDGEVRDEVDITVDVAGRIAGIDSRSLVPESQVVLLPGVVLPGFANGHSHAFHRARRGRTHGDGGTIWTWRERMYEVANVLDSDL